MTEESKDRFLETLREGWSVTAAAASAGCARWTFYRHRDADPEFAEAWQAAREEGIDRLVDEAVRRAVKGVERPIFGKGGEIVGTVTEYSDRLMEVLLRGFRPETFGTSAKLTINGGWEQPDLSGGPTLQELAVYLHSIGAPDPTPIAATAGDLPQLTAGGTDEEKTT